MEGRCGTTLSTLQLETTTRPTAQAFSANQVKYSTDKFRPKLLDLKKDIRPPKPPITNFQIAQDIFEQTEMVFQDFRESAMEAYIRYKAYYN